MRNLYDINNASDKVNIVDCYVKASKCLTLQGKYEEATISLSELLLNENLKGQRAQLLKGLADISKDSQDIEKFFVYAEGCLDVDPTDTDLRFHLAYHYSEKGHKKLSLLHYKKLTNTVENPTALNNLGIQYEELDLKGKSIKRLYEAADKKETLAMANLVRRYSEQGFVQDASEMIKRANILANEGIEVHGSVGHYKNQLDLQVREENTKERAFLIDAEKERDFRVRYGVAFLCDTVVQRDHLKGTWETPWGNIEISVDREENTIKAEQRTKLDSIKHRLVSIEGTIVNLSGTYRIEVIDTTEWSTGPSKDTFYAAVGYMVMRAEDNKTIAIMEKTKEDKMTLLNWRRMTN